MERIRLLVRALRWTVPAQVMPHLLRAVHSGVTVDDPPCGPRRLGQGEVGPFLTHQSEQSSAKQLGKGVDGHPGGWAGGPPLRPVGRDPTGWDQAIDVRMVGQRAAPGVQGTEDPDEPPDGLQVGGAREARVGGGAEHEVVQVLLLAADALRSAGGRVKTP
jgi:hypothetical protein